ncbi:MAG: hypothetical protein K0S79_121 [Nitrospira sp.]|jgi:hypothetical protein|nr:hypothetical protein [Nitrospira sp.]
MPRPNVRKVVCGECEWSGTEREVIDLVSLDVKALTPGDEVPAGGCPSCWGFAYLVKPSYVGGVR